MKKMSIDTITVYEANSFFAKLRGLIGREEMLKNGALLIPNCNWVHSFFMKSPIRVLFLDAHCNTIIFEQQLNPWRLSHMCLSARFSLEVSIHMSDFELKKVLSHLSELDCNLRT
jgi:uncharacterized protein